MNTYRFFTSQGVHFINALNEDQALSKLIRKLDGSFTFEEPELIDGFEYKFENVEEFKQFLFVDFDIEDHPKRYLLYDVAFDIAASRTTENSFYAEIYDLVISLVELL